MQTQVIFTSVTFIVFFAVVLCLLGLVRGASGRIWILLLASYVFYANWNVYYSVLTIALGQLRTTGLSSWGRKLEALRIGPATNCGKNDTNRKNFIGLRLATI